jgi:hypothetical protein
MTDILGLPFARLAFHLSVVPQYIQGNLRLLNFSEGGRCK